jgi:hypothetical protein
MSESAEKKRVRSPAYPGISLEQALDRVGPIYFKEKQHPASLDVIAKHWGLASSSRGNAMVLTAACKYFGLLEEDKSGSVRRLMVSDLAVVILESPLASQRRADAIKTAALMPKIYAELWEKYEHSLPSDENLRVYLLLDRKFNRDAIAGFLKAFRATIYYADLGEGDGTQADEQSRLQMEEEDGDQAEPAGIPDPEPAAQAQSRATDVFVSSGDAGLDHSTHGQPGSRPQHATPAKSRRLTFSPVGSA